MQSCFSKECQFPFRTIYGADKSAALLSIALPVANQELFQCSTSYRGTFRKYFGLSQNKIIKKLCA